MRSIGRIQSLVACVKRQEPFPCIFEATLLYRERIYNAHLMCSGTTREVIPCQV